MPDPATILAAASEAMLRETVAGAPKSVRATEASTVHEIEERRPSAGALGGHKALVFRVDARTMQGPA